METTGFTVNQYITSMKRGPMDSYSGILGRYRNLVIADRELTGTKRKSHYGYTREDYAELLASNDQIRLFDSARQHAIQDRTRVYVVATFADDPTTNQPTSANEFYGLDDAEQAYMTILGNRSAPCVRLFVFRPCGMWNSIYGDMTDDPNPDTPQAFDMFRKWTSA